MTLHHTHWIAYQEPIDRLSIYRDRDRDSYRDEDRDLYQNKYKNSYRDRDFQNRSWAMKKETRRCRQR